MEELSMSLSEAVSGIRHSSPRPIVARFEDLALSNFVPMDEMTAGMQLPTKSGRVDSLLHCDKELIDRGPPEIYRLHPREIMHNRNDKLRKCELGVKTLEKPEKVIMIVGATGSGKTTLINGMINYVLGVKWEDNFRFKLVVDPGEAKVTDEAESHTQWITAYTLYHQENFQVPYSLTIIDTPGFGDTRGINQDKITEGMINKFFNSRGVRGIDHLNAIGFVVKASATRLTPSQHFIFQSILSLFGKDIEKNIFMMLTFSDGQKPPALATLKTANIPYEKEFKFNNSALFASINDSSVEDEYADFERMFWKMGHISYKTFMNCLRDVNEVSLQLTKDVLKERHSLETHIEGIQKQLQIGISKLDAYETEIKALKNCEADINRNKEFVVEVNVPKFVKVNVPSGQFTTNCRKCNYTCHENCVYDLDDDKDKCSAMSNKYCTVCPQGCYWDLHHNLPYKFQTIQEKRRETLGDLKKRYDIAVDEKIKVETLIGKIMDDFCAVQVRVLTLADEIRKSLSRLQDIALCPNPFTTVEYINMLIESEKSKHEKGWKDRVRQLELAKKQAELILKLSKGSESAQFSKYQKEYERRIRRGEKEKDVLKKISLAFMRENAGYNESILQHFAVYIKRK